MTKRLGRPSPSLVIALVALFVALGGTSYAALSIPANSVGSKQLKKNAVTTAKIKNGAVTAGKINTTGLTVPNATHAGSADSALIGDSPVAWAQVSSSGTVVAGRGISSANVSRQAISAYCFVGLGFPFKSASVTIDYATVSAAGVGDNFAIGNPFGDCSSAQAEVATFDSSGFAPEGFFIQFYN